MEDGVAIKDADEKKKKKVGTSFLCFEYHGEKNAFCF